METASGRVTHHEIGAPDLRKLADAQHEGANFRELRHTANRMIARGQEDGNAELAAWGNFYHGVASIHLHNGRSAKSALLNALEYFREAGDQLSAARALMNLASVAIDIDVNAPEARRLYEEAAPIVRELGTARHRGTLCGNLGEVLRLEGEYGRALEYARESFDVFAADGDYVRAAWQLANIAHLEILQRNYSAAKTSVDRAIEYLRENPNALCVTWCFDVWIILIVKMQRWDVAAQLLGFVENVRGEGGFFRQQGMLPWLSEPIERLSHALSGDEFHALLDVGERLTLDEARSLARTVEV